MAKKGERKLQLFNSPPEYHFKGGPNKNRYSKISFLSPHFSSWEEKLLSDSKVWRLGAQKFQFLKRSPLKEVKGYIEGPIHAQFNCAVYLSTKLSKTVQLSE